MANCTSCGRGMPAFSTGELSTLCRECKARENAAPDLPSIAASNPSVISLSSILVGINVAVFVLMVVTGVSAFEPTSADLIKWGADWGPLSLSTQPWRLLTSNYVHIGIIHIALNMWCLFSLGALSTRIFDRWTYFLVYTATGIAGSLASLWWHPAQVGAGASGAIFGLAGALLAALYLGKLAMPKQAVQSTMKSLLTFTAYNLFFGMRMGVDNAAHIGGFASGLVLGAFLSKSLTQPPEVRQQWRTFALLLCLAGLGGGTFYLRHKHPEMSGVVNPRVYFDEYGKGFEAYKQEHYAEAAAAFQKAVKSNPNSADVHFMLGAAYQNMQKPDDAITQYQEALRLNPEDADAETALAGIYNAQGKTQEAQEATEKAAKLKSSR